MNNYLKQLLKTCGLENAIDCPHKVYTCIVPINEDTKVEVAARINRLLNIYPRYVDSGHVKASPTILLIDEGCCVFEQAPWPVSIQIPEKLVKGEQSFRFSYSKRPLVDEPLVHFIDDIADADRVRIAFGAYRDAVRLLYTSRNTMTIGDLSYFLECIPKAGVNPEVLATKLRLMYS